MEDFIVQRAHAMQVSPISPPPSLSADQRSEGLVTDRLYWLPVGQSDLVERFGDAARIEGPVIRHEGLLDHGLVTVYISP